VSELTTLGL